jgi:hypothetical protein
MNTEENRVKMSKYRARRSLRELGYTEDEIATLITFTNWSSTTPAQFLASLSPDNPPARVADRARQPRETPEATPPASVPRATTRRTRAEPEQVEQIPASETSETLKEITATLARIAEKSPGLALLLAGGGALFYVGYSYYQGHKRTA